METLITPSELAEMLHVPLSTLGQWRYLGRGPAYVKVGRHVRYRASEIEQWLEAQTVLTRNLTFSRLCAGGTTPRAR